MKIVLLFSLLMIMSYGVHFLALLMLLIFLQDKIYAKINLFEFLIYVVFFIYLILGLMLYPNSDTFLYGVTVFYFLVAVFCSKILVATNLEKLKQVVLYVIWFLVFIIILQYIVFFLSKYYLDVHKLLTLGKYESRIESSTLRSFGLVRATGVAIEPSNQSALLAYLIVIYFYLSGYLNQKYKDILLLVPMITLSFTSIAVFSTTYIVSKFLNGMTSLKKIIQTLVIASPIMLILGYISYKVMSYRINGEVDYDAVGFRMSFLSILEQMPFDKLMWGHGIYMSGTPLLLYGEETSHSHIRDTGLIFNMVFTFGLPLTLLFYYFMLLRISRVSKISALLFLVLGVLKFDYMQPVFWLVIVVILSLSKARGNNI